jgi:hypothetical protein
LKSGFGSEYGETKLMSFTFISFLECQTVKGSSKGQYKDQERDEDTWKAMTAAMLKPWLGWFTQRQTLERSKL